MLPIAGGEANKGDDAIVGFELNIGGGDIAGDANRGGEVILRGGEAP